MSPRRGDAPQPLDPEALAAVAEELYALPPADFTATRDARVREARARGERALATAVGGLRRPTAAAWLANLLVREERGQVEELLALGDALREAQAGLEGAALRQLSAQRHRVVAALAAQARRLAARHGQPAGADAAEQLEQTLEAAMADPAAAEALRSGRLTSGLAYAGLGELAGPAARESPPQGTAGPGARRVPPAAGARERDERQPAGTEVERAEVERAERERAERERAEAERAEAERAERERAEQERAEAERAEARRALAAAEAGLVDAERHVAEQDETVATAARRREAAGEQQAALQRQLADLRERLRLAEEEAAASLAEERARVTAREAAARGAEVARRRVEQARRRLERAEAD